MQPNPVVTTENLTKEYGSLKAVDGVTFQIMQGEIFGVLGPNGAGKTTLLEMMVGLRIPTGGTLHVLGLNPHRERQQLVRRIGVQPQQASLAPNLKVIETLELFASFHAEPLAPEAVLEMIGLNEKRDALVKQLSGGQRQRLLVGVALVANPELLFLDEPTSSLDPQARRQLWQVVQCQRDMKRTVILSTHHMDEAEILCDRVAVVDRGQILALDSPQNLVNTHFPERIIVCETAKAIDPVKLKCVPGVRDVSISPKGASYQVRIYTTETEMSLRGVLSNPGFISVRDLRVEQATLEDVFLRLTGRSISESNTSKKQVRTTM